MSVLNLIDFTGMIFVSAIASAADLRRRNEAPSAPVQSAYSWKGFYAG